MSGDPRRTEIRAGTGTKKGDAQKPRPLKFSGRTITYVFEAKLTWIVPTFWWSGHGSENYPR
jgi:hypothetical protein